jgi:tetratricopeptide (TPR) repeat protein
MDQLLAFISYARFDGRPFTETLRRKVPEICPHVQLRYDKDIPPGESFVRAIEQAIAASDVLLFVMTRGSMRDSEWCSREVLYAQQVGTPVVPLRVDRGEFLPVQDISVIDFIEDPEAGWRELARALTIVGSPAAIVQTLQERLSRMRLEARLAQDADSGLYENYRHELQVRIDAEKRRAEDPEAARRKVSEGILAGLAYERGAEPVPSRYSLRVVNEPPAVPPSEFRDRLREMQELERYLGQSSMRLIAVVGRDGIGKTTMVSQLRQRLAQQDLSVPVAFTYLPALGYEPVTGAAMLRALVRVAPGEEAADWLAERLHAPVPYLEKLDEILASLAGTRTIMAIDNAEVLLDQEAQILDRELSELINELVNRDDHAVTLVLVSRRNPDGLLRESGRHVVRLVLGEGLPRRDAYNLFLALDRDDSLGMRSLSVTEFEKIYGPTRGHPRALELVFGILRGEPHRSIQWLIDELDIESEDLVGLLAGWMFDRLDRIDQRVAQALAIYARPVLPAAVDYLLEPYLDGLSSESALGRLHGLRLVRQDGSRYYVPPDPDGKRLCAVIPAGTPADREREPQPYTKMALWHRAATYMVHARKNRIERVEDLLAQFAEIDLRMRGEEYSTALELMAVIDEAHLTGWGHSDSLVLWRQQLERELVDPHLKMHNLSWLASARQQQEDYRQEISHLSDALEQAEILRDQRDKARLHSQLAAAYFLHGKVSSGATYYQRAVAESRRLKMVLELAQARAGLALCRGKIGDFDRALHQQREADRILGDRADHESGVLRGQMLLNAGWIYGQLGRTVDARDALERGRSNTRDLDEHLLEGQILDGLAAVLIDETSLAEAIDLAGQAAVIAVRAGSARLAREANTTLALAYLCAGDSPAACAAADAGVRGHRPGQTALAAFALQGVTALRQGERSKARRAFLEADSQAKRLVTRDRRNYQPLDTQGLVLCGRALCGDLDCLDDATAAYRSARAITRARGAVQRSTRVLGQLLQGHESEKFADIRRAAAGK